MTSENIQLIPLNQLFRSALNVRKSGNGAIADLAANIKANGLLQNLVVTAEKRGKREGFGVVAGGRRLEALGVLAKAKVLDADAPVACRVVSKGEAIEASTAENMLRQAMHPADEFEAFAALIAAGAAAEQVAERFGTTVRRVEQRMKLARLSPKVISAYRDGILNLDAVEALTLTDDHATQEQLVKRGSLSAYSVRSALSGESVREQDRRLRFVGEDVYTAAGGVVREDLFSDARYFESTQLLQELATAKLSKAAAKLSKSFAWVEIEPEADWRTAQRFEAIPTIQGPMAEEVAAEFVDLSAQLQACGALLDAAEDEDDDTAWNNYYALRERVEAIETATQVPDPAAEGLAGAVVMLKESGKVEILRNVLRTADRRKLTKLRSDAGQAAGDVNAEVADPSPVRVELTTFATGVAQLHTAKNAPVAMRLLAYQLARTIIGNGYGGFVDVRLRAHDRLCARSDTLQGSSIGTELEALDQHWHAAIPDTDEALYIWCLQADEDTVLQLLAYLTAKSLNGVENFAARERPLAPCLSALGVKMADHWSPNAAYFAKIKKSATLAALAEHRHTDPAFAKLKRPALAERAAELLQGSGWLPPSLR